MIYNAPFRRQSFKRTSSTHLSQAGIHHNAVLLLHNNLNCRHYEWLGRVIDVRELALKVTNLYTFEVFVFSNTPLWRQMFSLQSYKYYTQLVISLTLMLFNWSNDLYRAAICKLRGIPQMYVTIIHSTGYKPMCKWGIRCHFRPGYRCESRADYINIRYSKWFDEQYANCGKYGRTVYNENLNTDRVGDNNLPPCNHLNLILYADRLT